MARASRACKSDGNGTTHARPIITTSWRSRRMVRSNGPVSGPDESRAARSRSASAPVAFRPVSAAPMPSWIRCRASLSRPRVRPASNSANAAASSSSRRAALTRIWLIARDGSTRKETASPVSAPTVTSMTRSIAKSSGLAWLMAGTSSTITAVTVAAFRLGLMAADERERRDRQHQQRQQAAFAGMRDQHRDGAAIDRAADRSQHVVAGRLQRPADAHLGDDQRCQHRP